MISKHFERYCLWANPSDAGVILTDRAINAEFLWLARISCWTNNLGVGMDIYVCISVVSVIDFNTLRPGQISRHVADDTFKCIILNEYIWI